MQLVIMQLLILTNALLISGSDPVYRARKGQGDLHNEVAPGGASSSHGVKRPSSISVAPSILNEPAKRRNNFSAVAPSVAPNKHHHARHRIIHSAPRSPAYPPQFHRQRGSSL
ncbi:hypothetical protein SAY86_016762 [Trapa natans]|uniref:Secreted protein n=1 Tax=Trapa natans TaxID=22666 RepID=A0AAN7M073_TRANT|nr:hypothetical protein SAY86_016762 [Trapa natans]